MTIAVTTQRSLRPMAIGYGVAVGVAASLASWVLMAVMPGDSEGKLWAMYAWRLIFLPATLVLGISSVAVYDRFRRSTSLLKRFGVVFVNVALVAAVPYLVAVALSVVSTRQR